MDARAHGRCGGDVVVDGLLNTDDFADEAGVQLPEGPYETVAGYVMAELGHLPRVGETVDVAGHRLTVDELDGRRVARVRVSQPEPTGEGAPEQPSRESAGSNAEARDADRLEG